MLVDALSDDSDPLVRELSIPKQRALGGLVDISRLKQLLEDRSPSVRTAVLRELSEKPNSKAIETLVEYVRRESDENLLVFATKTLGKLSNQKVSEEALNELTTNERWRVRAAAVDAIGEVISGNGRYRSGNENVPSPLQDAVVNRLEDSDPFVVSRAELLLKDIISEKTATAIAQYWVKNPQKFDAAIEQANSYELEAKLGPIAKKLLESLEKDDSSHAGDAARIIVRIDPNLMQDQIVKLLDSEDVNVRIVGMDAFIACIASYRKDLLEDRNGGGFSGLGFDTAGQLEPWHPVPDSFKRLPSKKTATNKSARIDNPSRLASGDKSKPKSSDSSADSAAPSLDDFFGKTKEEKMEGTNAEVDTDPKAQLNAVDDFFGANNQAEAKEEQPKEDSELKRKTDLKNDPDLRRLASTWMAKWQNGEDSLQSEKWFASSKSKLNDLLAQEGVAGKQLEYGWLVAAALVSGQSEFSEQVVQILKKEVNSEERKSRRPTQEQLLSWLEPKIRRNFVLGSSID